MSTGRKSGDPRHKVGKKRQNVSPAAIRIVAKRKLREVARRKHRKQLSPESELSNSVILDALVGNRSSKWVPMKDRRGTTEIGLTNFSFIDAPESTLDRLRDLVLADCGAKETKLNFTDIYCRDIGPYMVLCLMEPDLASNNISGGTVWAPVRKVLEATEISKKLKMSQGDKSYDTSDVWPIKIENCRYTPSPDRTDIVASHAELADKFASHVNAWLEVVGFMLTEDGEGKLMRLVAEVLENAIIHSKPNTQDGEAWLAGYMASMVAENGNEARYICHLTILNLGNSIFESMQTCSASVRNEIEGLIESHSRFFRIRKKWSKTALWTLYALQDGVTRLGGPDMPAGGKGLMDMVEFFQDLGGAAKDGLGTRMVLISGDTCIQIDDQRPEYDSRFKRRLALNESNDLHKVPDGNYIWTMKRNFPGTILSMRFYLDPKYLAELVGDN